MQTRGHQSERLIKIFSQLDPEKQKELERYARLLKKDDKLSALKKGIDGRRREKKSGEILTSDEFWKKAEV